MTAVFWIAFVFVIVGLGVSIYAAVKALNTSFSPNEDHILFWVGTVFTTIGVVMFIYLAASYMSKTNSLTKQKEQLYMKIMDLQNQLGQCKGIPSASGASGSSGPGFFSRGWNKFKGFFNRNASVPVAGNPGEVNPFKAQETSL
jgi:uncharacterized protein YjeT (DUF2065 family)